MTMVELPTSESIKAEKRKGRAVKKMLFMLGILAFLALIHISMTAIAQNMPELVGMPSGPEFGSQSVHSVEYLTKNVNDARRAVEEIADGLIIHEATAPTPDCIEHVFREGEDYYKMCAGLVYKSLA